MIMVMIRVNEYLGPSEQLEIRLIAVVAELLLPTLSALEDTRIYSSGINVFLSNYQMVSIVLDSELTPVKGRNLSPDFMELTVCQGRGIF